MNNYHTSVWLVSSVTFMYQREAEMGIYPHGAAGQRWEGSNTEPGTRARAHRAVLPLLHAREGCGV